jgi:hypothetical protein
MGRSGALNAATLGQAGLRARLWLTRCGWSNGLAVLLLLLGGAAWLWGMPQLERQAAAGKRAFAAAQKNLDSAPTAAPIPALPLADQRLQQFYDALGESRYAEQQVKTLFALAAKNGLSLNQAEYKFAAHKEGLFHTYTIALPIKGPYNAIRPFCEQVLLAIPFASLDEVDFKRDAVTNASLDAKLRFTLHLDNVGGIGATDADRPGGEP